MRLYSPDKDIVIPDITHKDSPLKKMLGLRFRRTGRAYFSFDKPVRAPIDMFLVLTPLDLAFLDADNTIIDIQTASPVTPRPKTWTTYHPDDPYTAVLEVEPGLLTELDIRPGHRLTPI